MTTKIEHRIGVPTPPEPIWEVIADLEGWSAWNPLYTQASGAIRIGERLTLRLELPGQKPETIQPRVIDWAPYDHLHWGLSMMGGLVRTVRYIEIEKLNDGACIFSNGEVFGGLLGGLVAKMLRRNLRQGFTAMGEAVRDQALARWTASHGEPT